MSSRVFLLKSNNVKSSIQHNTKCEYVHKVRSISCQFSSPMGKTSVFYNRYRLSHHGCFAWVRSTGILNLSHSEFYKLI